MPPYLSGMDIEEIAEMQRRGKLIATQAAQIAAMRAALAFAEEFAARVVSGSYIPLSGPGSSLEALASIREALAATKEDET